MNVDYKGMTIYQANKDGEGTFYFVEGMTAKFKLESLAKRAITMHLNRKDSEVIVAPMGKQTAKVIEVVPRTQQEIDDYGPNGIQPPIRKDRSYLDEVISRFKPVMKIAESRNQREGRYAGYYSAQDKNFKPSHHRQGQQMIGSVRAFWSLKEYGRYLRQNGL